jgi:hypothetical protein
VLNQSFYIVETDTNDKAIAAFEAECTEFPDTASPQVPVGADESHGTGLATHLSIGTEKEEELNESSSSQVTDESQVDSEYYALNQSFYIFEDDTNDKAIAAFEAECRSKLDNELQEEKKAVLEHDLNETIEAARSKSRANVQRCRLAIAATTPERDEMPIRLCELKLQLRDFLGAILMLSLVLWLTCT